MLLAVVKPLKSGTATPPQATEVFSLSQEISCIFSRVKFKLLFSSSACAPQQQRNSNWGGCFVEPQHETTEPQLPVLKSLSALWLSSFPAHTAFPSGSRESPQASCTHSGPTATSAPGLFVFLPHFLFPRPSLPAAALRAWLQLCSCAAQLFPGKPTAMLSPSCSHSCSREKGNFYPPHPLWASPGALWALSCQLLSESQTKPFPVHRSLFIPSQMLPCKNHSKINALPSQWLSTITCGSSCQQLWLYPCWKCHLLLQEFHQPLGAATKNENKPSSVEYYWEKAPFLQNARLHWASPAASQDQMCSLLLAWDAASSQWQFPGYRSALWAATWWANPRCSWVCFHKAACSGRLILIPHSKALVLTKIPKPQVPVNKHNPISALNPSSDSIQVLLQLLKCHLHPSELQQTFSLEVNGLYLVSAAQVTLY